MRTVVGFVTGEWIRDVVYAARVLRRAPFVTVLSVGTIGLGIGASALLFALVNGIVLSPLPYPDADRLVRIFDVNRSIGVDRGGAASGNIDDWRQRATGLEAVAGLYSMGRTISADTNAEVLMAAQVSRDFFPLLRVQPLVGRTFTEDEIRRAQYNSAAAPTGPDPVVVIAESLWRQRFGSDPAILERTIMLERRPFRVVGVMPAAFAMPSPDVRLWIPWDLSGPRPRDQHYLTAIGRLAPGVTLRDAADDLNRVAAELGAEYPATNQGWGVALQPLADDMVGDAARVLWVLFAAVGLVLVVSCANVALLSLMRGLDRQSETGMRLALGASSGRLLRQCLLESALVAALGGVAGTALAFASLRVLPLLAPALPRLQDVAIDGRAISFIVAMTGLATLVSGLPPAWRRSRTVTLASLAHDSGRSTSGRGRHLVRDAMVVAQVALAVVLVVGSGLLLRSFLQLRATDHGFDPRGVLVVPIFLDSQAYSTGDRARAYYAQLLERLRALPGVVAVGSSTTVPTSPLGPDFERPVWPEHEGVDSSKRLPAAVRVATPGHFAALGVSIVDGRALEDRDRAGAPGVVVVSETLARTLWPGTSAVGQRLVVDYSTAGTAPYDVIGVARDVRFRGPRSEPLAEIYLAHAQRPYLIQNVTIKATGDPRRLIPEVRAVLEAIDPHKPPHGIHTLDDLIGATIARDRQAMVMMAVFAGVALALSVLSVYGVLAQRVRERSREIGIRMAIGAQRSRLVGWVAGLGLRLIALGVALGLGMAWAVAGALRGMLYGVAPADPLTALAAVGLLAIVGLVATLIPSWHATRIDPVTILRRG